MNDNLEYWHKLGFTDYFRHRFPLSGVIRIAESREVLRAYQCGWHRAATSIYKPSDRFRPRSPGHNRLNDAT